MTQCTIYDLAFRHNAFDETQVCSKKILEVAIYTQVNIQWEQYRANERVALREY